MGAGASAASEQTPFSPPDTTTLTTHDTREDPEQVMRQVLSLNLVQPDDIGDAFHRVDALMTSRHYWERCGEQQITQAVEDRQREERHALRRAKRGVEGALADLERLEAARPMVFRSNAELEAGLLARHSVQRENLMARLEARRALGEEVDEAGEVRLLEAVQGAMTDALYEGLATADWRRLQRMKEAYIAAVSASPDVRDAALAELAKGLMSRHAAERDALMERLASSRRAGALDDDGAEAELDVVADRQAREVEAGARGDMDALVELDGERLERLRVTDLRLQDHTVRAQLEQELSARHAQQLEATPEEGPAREEAQRRQAAEIEALRILDLDEVAHLDGLRLARLQEGAPASAAEEGAGEAASGEGSGSCEGMEAPMLERHAAERAALEARGGSAEEVAALEERQQRELEAVRSGNAAEVRRLEAERQAAADAVEVPAEEQLVALEAGLAKKQGEDRAALEAELEARGAAEADKAAELQALDDKHARERAALQAVAAERLAELEAQLAEGAAEDEALLALMQAKAGVAQLRAHDLAALHEMEANLAVKHQADRASLQARLEERRRMRAAQGEPAPTPEEESKDLDALRAQHTHELAALRDSHHAQTRANLALQAAARVQSELARAQAKLEADQAAAAKSAENAERMAALHAEGERLRAQEEAARKSQADADEARILAMQAKTQISNLRNEALARQASLANELQREIEADKAALQRRLEARRAAKAAKAAEKAAAAAAEASG